MKKLLAVVLTAALGFSSVTVQAQEESTAQNSADLTQMMNAMMGMMGTGENTEQQSANPNPYMNSMMNPMAYFMKSSPRSMLPSKSQKAISGSIIQNSAA